MIKQRKIAFKKHDDIECDKLPKSNYSEPDAYSTLESMWSMLSVESDVADPKFPEVDQQMDALLNSSESDSRSKDSTTQ